MLPPAQMALPGTSLEVEQQPVMPEGFAAGGLACGIKASGRPDLAVLVVTTDAPASAAATFTRSRMAAAPVRLSQAHLAASRGTPPDQSAQAGQSAHAGFARAIIVTSGSANAATGPEGEADQVEIAAMLAERVDCAPEETLLASTGLIGTRLPLDKVRDGLSRLVPEGLSADEAGLEAAARAIQTTDSRLKTASVSIALPDPDGNARSVTVSGFAKGVGMINPRMATMIAVLATDAAATPVTLAGLLREAVGASFDQLTVDGDTSTNDTVFLLASGASGAAEVRPGSREAAALGEAIAVVCRSLARQQAADGEGATSLITCRVTGAQDLVDARAVARAVVASSLVKAAVHGRDPNWGRVAAAAGAARRPDGQPVALTEAGLAIALCGTHVFEGRVLDFDRAAVRSAMDAPEVLIEVGLGEGQAVAEAFGCDLSEEYVIENAEYTT